MIMRMMMRMIMKMMRRRRLVSVSAVLGLGLWGIELGIPEVIWRGSLLSI